MSSLLSVDPMKRCKCSEALKQPYFSNRPHPTPGPMLPMPSSLSNDDETSASDLNVLPGSRRKLHEGFETSRLAKKLVFWSLIFFHCFSFKYKNKVIWWWILARPHQTTWLRTVQDFYRNAVKRDFHCRRSWHEWTYVKFAVSWPYETM